MKSLLSLFLVGSFILASAQTHNLYEISFPNAVHHEAEITATFDNLEDKVLEVRMNRTSPGRYALHEFAKNVYNVKATDGQGNDLEITRPDPYSWLVSGHDGTVVVSYTLFANHGDGTYSQIDETHAHLNIPATFMYAPALALRPNKVTFNVREDLNWKVATQLKSVEGNTYYAPDLQYFMDSPTEISDYQMRSFTETSNGKEYDIRFVLHHQGTEAELDEYFEKVKKVVRQQTAVYGELPDFDFGQYTFLACYMPQVDGDGMEHRNSTILTRTLSLADGGMQNNISTVSHEFFHAWNVERIRPISLEPFDFTETNMSGELWFAEGFTSYYTDLILCRAGPISQEDYIKGLAGGLNYVWNSPAREYFNPIEMSYQAPFADAARSVDPVNRENTFISYYTYGSVLGLALDLSLRGLDNELSLDGFMQEMWKKHGKTEIPYTVKDIESTLVDYSGKEFASSFFDNFIYQSQMPDYAKLFEQAGIDFSQPKIEAWLGVYVRPTENGLYLITNPYEDGPAYEAGLDQGDVITSINDQSVKGINDLSALMKTFVPGQMVSVRFIRHGLEKKTMLKFGADPSYQTLPFESAEKKVSKAARQFRDSWLGEK